MLGECRVLFGASIPVAEVGKECVIRCGHDHKATIFKASAYR